MKFMIYTLGCKVNAYESEMMREKLLQSSYVEDEEHPDIVIVNTCSVTNIADQKSRKMVRHFKNLHPQSILVVAGCSSLNKTSDYQNIGIDILLGNTEKSKIVSLLDEYFKTKTPYIHMEESRLLPFEDMSVSKFTTHTRAYMKIQDGCDNFCTYCIIPYVRGSRRNKDFELCLKEARQLVSHGHKEIVLTGIHTGSYQDHGHDLTDLIHEMSQIEELQRIRISSIEITELTPKFLQELKENAKICDHLHIPLQAGSDEILKLMNRKYTIHEFKEKIQEILRIRPDMSITTDVIVGFPGESEELFLKTVETVKKIGFSKIHVFPYSKREGTKAALMEGQVLDQEKHERSKILGAVSKELEIAYASKFLNRVMPVLIEKGGKEYSVGSTSNYLKVKVLEEVQRNEIVMVKLTSLNKDMVLGERIVH